MKRFIALILTALIAVSITVSCGNEQEKTEYVCSEEVYTLEDGDRQISVAYPVITGAENGEALSEALRNASVGFMEHYMLYTAGKNGFSRYIIDSVTVGMQSEKLASFLCVGSYSDEGSEHPDTVVYTLNLDPRTGKLYDFDELIADFDPIALKFRDGGFTLVSGSDASGSNASGSDASGADASDNGGLLSDSGYIELLTKYSSLYSVYDIYPPLYFIQDENKIRLAFSVDLVYTDGGHAEFAVDADSVSSALTETARELLN